VAEVKQREGRLHFILALDSITFFLSSFVDPKYPTCLRRRWAEEGMVFSQGEMGISFIQSNV